MPRRSKRSGPPESKEKGADDDCIFRPAIWHGDGRGSLFGLWWLRNGGTASPALHTVRLASGVEYSPRTVVLKEKQAECPVARYSSRTANKWRAVQAGIAA